MVTRRYVKVSFQIGYAMSTPYTKLLCTDEFSCEVFKLFVLSKKIIYLNYIYIHQFIYIFEFLCYDVLM